MMLCYNRNITKKKKKNALEYVVMLITAKIHD